MRRRMRKPAGDDHVQFELQAQRQHARQRSPGFEQARGCARLRSPASCVQRSSQRAVADLGFGDAEAPQIVLRKINAPLAPVDGDVLPEIGELQAGADRIGLRARRVVIDPVEVKQQTSDRVRRTRAIVADLGEIGVARLDDILPERGQQRAQRSERQRVRADRAVASDAKGGSTGCLATFDGVEHGAVAVERREALASGVRVALVGDVVGAARERVDRDDRTAQLRRSEPRCNRESFRSDRRTPILRLTERGRAASSWRGSRISAIMMCFATRLRKWRNW